MDPSTDALPGEGASAMGDKFDLIHVTPPMVNDGKPLDAKQCCSDVPLDRSKVHEL